MQFKSLEDAQAYARDNAEQMAELHSEVQSLPCVEYTKLWLTDESEACVAGFNENNIIVARMFLA